jgi:hypothetical protein
MRLEGDRYYTKEAQVIREMLRRIPESTFFYECCSGAGHISNEISGRGDFVVTNDSNTLSPAEYHYDATLRESWEELTFLEGTPEWTVTNPPFNVAHLILPLAYEYSSVGVAFLLRLSYFEPTANRGQWLIEHKDQMRYLIPHNPRIKYRDDRKGSDSVTTAWFAWEKAWSWKKLGIECPFDFIKIKGRK